MSSQTQGMFARNGWLQINRSTIRRHALAARILDCQRMFKNTAGFISWLLFSVVDNGEKAKRRLAETTNTNSMTCRFIAYKNPGARSLRIR